MRQTVTPALATTSNKVDKHIRLLLDASGPRFVHQRAVEKQILARRVGNLWMTHAFAEVLFQVVNHAKVSR